MSRRKKVLMISRRYLPSTGGVEKHIENIGKTLSENHSLTILTEKYARTLLSDEKIDNVRVLRFSFPKIKYLGLLIVWLKCIKYLKVIYSSDIIHIHDVFIWYLPFRFIFFWKPTFITFHGWEGRYPIPVFSLFQKKLAFYLTTGSIGVGNYISKYYSISPNITVYGAVSMKPTAKIYAKKNIILFLGRLESDTGVGVFLRLLSKNNQILRKYTVVFCGDGKARQICEKHGIVTGFVDPTSFLNESNICIASGYLSVFESLRMKCYTIVVTHNFFRKRIFSITPFNLRINTVRSSGELEKILVDYISHAKRFQKAITANSKWAKSYTWRRISEDYLKLWAHDK